MAGNEKIDVFKFYDMQANRDDGCWPWIGSVGGRKGEPRPYFQAQGKRYLAYRLVYELVHGIELTPAQMILHSCDNGSMLKGCGCGNPAHLSIGEQQDNSDDMKERQRHGLNHHTVKGIRRLLSEGRTQQDIADLYGVSREAIKHINNGTSHSHVKEDSVVDIVK